MHPVTAHGFNIGLGGQRQLAHGILTVWRDRRDIADPYMLHRVYSSEHPAARLARHVGLRFGQHLPFVRHGIAAIAEAVNHSHSVLAS